jgi:hypothetical protein
VHRAVEVKKGRVGQGLPALFRADKDDAALPQFSPSSLVLRANCIESVETGFGRHPGRVLVRLMVHRAAHHAGDLPEAVALPRAGTKPVCGRKVVVL